MSVTQEVSGLRRVLMITSAQDTRKDLEFTTLADSVMPQENELLAAANHHKQVATIFEDDQA